VLMKALASEGCHLCVSAKQRVLLREASGPDTHVVKLVAQHVPGNIEAILQCCATVLACISCWVCLDLGSPAAMRGRAVQLCAPIQGQIQRSASGI
jgi:hypothetical protein